jgi:phospho-N-acetylmuramoyl-pentapeptide-transferase
MLYYLFEYLDKTLNVSGAGVFQYITFRSALAFYFLFCYLRFSVKRIINFLRNQQVGNS